MLIKGVRYLAKLVTFMYANEARNDNVNGQNMHTINNPLLALKPAFIPGQLSFAVIFGITDFDFTKEHTFQFRLTAPDGKIAIDTGEIPIPAPKNIDGQNLSKSDGFIGSFDLRNVVFLTEGLYRDEVIFDGVKLREDEILVTGAGINGDSNKL